MAFSYWSLSKDLLYLRKLEKLNKKEMIQGKNFVIYTR